ncbi:LysR substrate-binding domain-containing protein [Paraburkholderia sp. EG287A]|uniref:LysR substrate-binding domain-containing protein n=1 Tax=unclassified Paraburkholderia TaxID=2615204 RepID=UPI0034D30680
MTPPSRFRLDDLAAIADAVAAGEGLGWLPFWLVRERVREGALVELLPAQRVFLYDAYAIWLRTPHVPVRVRLAVEEPAQALME